MSLSKIDALVKEVKQTRKMDISRWKEFKIGGKDGLFECDTAKQILKVDDGDFPYITRSAFNNGITRFVKKVDNKINEGNCITIGAEGFYAFYQENPFMAGNKIYVLRHKKLNKNNGLFICSVLNSIVEKYSYNNARILERIKDEIHKLPMNKKGEPDWEYMENYIREYFLSYQKSNLIKFEKLYKEIQNETKINLGEWKEFNLCGHSGIFELKNSISKIHNKNINGEFGNIPYVTRTEINNGIAKYIPEQKVKINSGNCLTIGMDAITIFYQEKDFYTGDKIKILRNKNLNKTNSLFLITVISNKIKQNFSWGGKGLNFKELTKLTIKLPSKDNQPDWEYMEYYINKLFEKIEYALL